MSFYDDDLYDVGALSIGSVRDRRSAANRSGSRGGMASRARPRASAQLMAPNSQSNRFPGVPGLGLRLQPLGFGAVIFALASGALLSTTSRPQRPFQGKRLVVDIARTGTTSTGLVSIGQLLIGSNNQFVSANPIGAAVFAPGAYDTNLELDAASVGNDVTIQFTISTTPTGTDTVVVQPTILGESIG